MGVTIKIGALDLSSLAVLQSLPSTVSVYEDVARQRY